MKLAVTTLLLLLSWAAPAAAQAVEGDPRDVDDPRSTGDPRDVVDPRDERDPEVPPEFEQLEGRELLDALYEHGATGALTGVMREQAWSLLGYIDSHCEAWLALVEAGGLDSEQGRADAAELVAKAKGLAQLADNALRDSRFTLYVDTFTSWDAEQQVSFREGQAHFGEARKLLQVATTPQMAQEALTSLQRSLDRARPLGDTWGQSMTLTAMGQVHLANRQFDEARATMRDAVDVGRTIRDLDSVWNGLNVIYEASMALEEIDAAAESLQQQYQLSLEVGDQESAQRVVERLLQLDALDRARQEGRG